jgi:tetratricopeptide (TPR) repeat protein
MANANAPLRGSATDVVRALQQGQFTRALAIGRSLLAASPANPDLLQLTAIAALQSGAEREGADLLQRAHAMRPDDPGIAFNLAKALGAIGQHEGTLAIVSRPAFAQVADFMWLAADSCRALRRYAEARKLYEALLAQAPADPRLLNNLGNVCMSMADFPAAIGLFEQACQRDPQLVEARINLAKALNLAGNIDRAIEAAESAYTLAPSEVAAVIELARALRAGDRSPEALDLLIKAFDANRRNGELALEIGHTFNAIAEFDRAEESYRQAMRLSPHDGQAYLGLGIQLEQANRLDELAQVIALAQRNKVQGAEIDHIMAMHAYRTSEYEVAAALANRPDPDEAVPASLHNQLKGQIADRSGGHAEAWEAFTQMNAAAASSAAGRHFDGSEYSRYIEEQIAVLDADWFGSWPELAQGGRPSPVFLVGFPRSGTTLLDTMLMGHPSLHVLEEVPVLASIHARIGDLANIANLDAREVDELRAAYFEGVHALGPVPDAATIVDKLPLNLLRAPLIHRLFPDAKFILALRHPCDCVLSCFMQNFQVNRAMASFWNVESAARVYDLAFSYFEKCRSIMPLNVHQIRYEDLIADQSGEIARLASFLGLESNEEMLDFQKTAKDRGRVRTPSYSQITEGVYQRARGRWLNYRDHMGAAIKTLAPWVSRHGYEPINGN